MSQNSYPSTRRNFLVTAGAGLAALGVGSLTATAAHQAPKVPGPPPKKARWAIVGLGKLAIEEILPAFALTNQSELAGLVSGDAKKAAAIAAHYGIAKENIFDYQKYDKLKENDQIDVAYICLPNSMHAEFTIRALEAGKHVLCEKPMAASAAECRKMIDVAKRADRRLMVAYRLRYEPFNQTIIRLAREKAYGAIKVIEATNMQNVAAPNIRLRKDLAGGPLMDVGIYCLNAARYITGEEPIECTAVAHRPANDPRFKEVDESLLFTLKFPSGVVAQCGSSFGVQESRRLRVVAENGWFDLDNAFAYTGLTLHTNDGKQTSDVKLPQVNHFAHEMDHFSDCVLNNKPPVTPGEDGLADLIAIEKIMQAAQSGERVKIG